MRRTAASSKQAAVLGCGQGGGWVELEVSRGLWSPRTSCHARLAPPAHGHTGSLGGPRGERRWVTVQLESAPVVRRRRHWLQLISRVTPFSTRTVLTCTQAHWPLTQVFVGVHLQLCAHTCGRAPVFGHVLERAHARHTRRASRAKLMHAGTPGRPPLEVWCWAGSSVTGPG